MAGWLHGVFVGDWLFVFPLCGFSLSLFCNYSQQEVPAPLFAQLPHRTWEGSGSRSKQNALMAAANVL